LWFERKLDCLRHWPVFGVFRLFLKQSFTLIVKIPPINFQQKEQLPIEAIKFPFKPQGLALGLSLSIILTLLSMYGTKISLSTAH
jgi:hypothetical protein